MTRLDDLLGYDDRPKPARKRGLATRVIVLPILVVTVSWIVYSVMRRLVGIGTPFVLVLAVVSALVILQQTLRFLKIEAMPSTLRDNPYIEQPPPYSHDGVRDAARSWNNRLDYAHDDPRHFNRMVQPVFVEIIEERIRFAHGVSRAIDPDRFREIVGPALWKFMTEPVSRRVTSQEIAALVAQMEAL